MAYDPCKYKLTTSQRPKCCDCCGTIINVGEEYLLAVCGIFCVPECLYDYVEIYDPQPPEDTFSLCSCEDRPCCGCPTKE